jgi:DNA-binding NtrC family response regulator
LQSFGCDVLAVTDGRAAIEAMAVGQFDFVVTDLRMPHADGMEVLAASNSNDSDRPVVLVTAHGTMHVAVAAMREVWDAISFLTKVGGSCGDCNTSDRAHTRRLLTTCLPAAPRHANVP